jgi:chemotaxis methyl-accepting protein methylase
MTALEQVASLVWARTGIVTKPPQLPRLERALGRALPGYSAERFLDEAGANGGEALMARLIDEVTIKETYFYRSPNELLSIPWRMHLDAARARGDDHVRVWVAACATGEEAYTVAMLACDALGPSAPVSILATDISEMALARARRAVYSGRSPASLPADLRDRYLEPVAGGVTPAEAVRSMVAFGRHNLVAHPPPGVFDVVVCRNVMIYFDADTVESATALLERALVLGGTAILGAADRLPAAARQLMRRDPPPPRRVRSPRSAQLPETVRVTVAPEPAPPPEEALRAADRGDLTEAIALAARAIAADPHDARAHFVRGIAELGTDDPAAAIVSLRRALYIEPAFGLAAFQLARAYDVAGDERAAIRLYGRALGTLDAGVEHSRSLLGKLAVPDLADACRARLLAAGARVSP